MIKFEKVSRFKDEDIKMPARATANAAGYDMAAAEDVLIPPYYQSVTEMCKNGYSENSIFTLDAMKKMTDRPGARPVLVSTGIKCKLPLDKYLELSVRSSTPLKYWLILANGVGIIDADYYDCEANEGEIFFQLINLSPYPIQIKKGDIIGQGIIKKYYKTSDDTQFNKTRAGGFGSTDADNIAVSPALMSAI